MQAERTIQPVFEHNALSLPSRLQAGKPSGDAGFRGSTVEHYFFDLHFGDEQVVDDEGVDHFDVGSAVYYGQRIADRIGRDADYRSLSVHIRTDEGALLAILTASAGRGLEQRALMGR